MVLTTRTVLHALAALLLTVSALAAATFSSRGVANSGCFPDTAFPTKPSVVWRAHLGAGNVGAMPSNALLADGTVFVALGKNLYALSAETGELYWQQALYEKPLGDILLVDGMIVVTHLNGMVRGYHVDDGSMAWDTKLSGYLRNGPMVSDDAIIFATKSGTIAGLERSTGKLVREIDVAGKITAAPLPIGQSLILAFEDGKILQLEKGRSRLLSSIPDVTVTYTPASDGKIVLIYTSEGLVLVDPANRTDPISWSYPLATRQTDAPAIAGDAVYLASRTGRLYSLDLKTGSERWVKTTINLVDGTEVAKKEVGIALPAAALGNPVVYGDAVIVRMDFGLLAAYGADDGQLRWQYQLPAPPKVTKPDAPKEQPAVAAATAPATPNATSGVRTGRGNRAGDTAAAATSTDTTAAIARIIGTPAVSGDDVFFAGSDGSIYHLSSASVDIDPPTITPSIKGMTIKDDRGMVTEPTVTAIAITVVDEGAGVDPAAMAIMLDSKNMTDVAVSADAGERFTLTLPKETPLTSGLHQLKVTARDYRGNTGTTSFDFIVGVSDATPAMPLAISSEFLPRNIKATPGTIVVWTNKSGGPRTVVSDTGHFTSDTLYPDGVPNGGTWAWVVPADAQPGTGYYYYCRLNGKPGSGTQFGTGLTGRIEIIAGAAQAQGGLPGQGSQGVGPAGFTPNGAPPGFTPNNTQGGPPGFTPNNTQGGPPGFTPNNTQGGPPGFTPNRPQGGPPGFTPNGIPGAPPGFTPNGMPSR